MDNTTIHFLMGVPLDVSQTNTLSWSDIDTQANYFLTKTFYSMPSTTYQRHNNFIRVDRNYETMLACNYVMYRNLTQSQKWFYAFVTDIKYVNDSRTDIFIADDVLQTYYFDVEYLQSFIEREHVSDDTIGAHTIPEAVEIGNYKYGEAYNPDTSVTLDDYMVVLGCTMDIDTDEMDDLFGQSWGFGSSFSGLAYFAYSMSEADDLKSKLSEVTSLGKDSGIVTIFMYPSAFITRSGHRITDTLNTINYTITPPTSIDGYTPKNNKLLCSPYNFIYATNGQGQAVEFQYEYFRDYSPEFMLMGFPAESNKIILRAIGYGKDNFQSGDSNYNYIDDSISMPAFPQCSWATDVFTAWYAQSGTAWAVNSTVGLVSAGTSVAAGNVAGAVGSFAGIFNSLMEVRRAAIAPPNIHGNAGNGSSLLALREYSPKLVQKNIRQEYAKIIDNYWSMFGYKVNALKVPEIRNRAQWSYIKTLECNITGNISTTDKDKIAGCFNNGVRFWKNPENVGNFNLYNGAA